MDSWPGPNLRFSVLQRAVVRRYARGEDAGFFSPAPVPVPFASGGTVSSQILDLRVKPMWGLELVTGRFVRSSATS